MDKNIKERITQKLKERRTYTSREFIIAMAIVGAILLFIKIALNI